MCVFLRERNGKSVCMCERERNGKSVCMCERERNGNSVCMCLRDCGILKKSEQVIEKVLETEHIAKERKRSL